jgi:hypothetical protein
MTTATFFPALLYQVCGWIAIITYREQGLLPWAMPKRFILGARTYADKSLIACAVASLTRYPFPVMPPAPALPALAKVSVNPGNTLTHRAHSKNSRDAILERGT